ncbi:DEAD/DEAH box helicase [Bradyrhizobium sp. 48]|uniref:DEAD/DEAH box helicase n=1 Tax=Bradyrhizobium sp. 48 TaxID=2782676 RepID=UPI001FFAED77|nr:DEAD/DEAH box helicase [Bradyrhizobium sp. 48]
MPDSENRNPIERALLASIKNLAQGRLIPILRESVPDVAPIDTDVQDRALQALQQMLLRGVKSLAAQLRRRTDVAPREGGIEPASDIFVQVKALCIEPIADVLGPSDHVYSLFPGPLHLANLLLAVERDLLGTALVRVPTPGDLPEDGWWQIIRRMARDRPYLWRNHREAIASGYLDRGVSSAISFPTGGGKSTLAELKIATALLRGEKVVFLAPTHSLVGQTARALKKTFQSYDIIGDIEEDVTLVDAVILPEVTVTTPERCLMLMSIQPEAFAGLGLIVFDECHLLHPRDEDRSRRGIDAMLALLNLTSLAPEADLLLLSAMMKNTEEISGWIEWLTGRKCLTLDLAWKPTRQVRGCVVYPAEQISNLNKKILQARRAKPKQRAAPTALKRELLASPFGLFSLLQTWGTMDRQDYALLPLLKTPQPLSTGVRKLGGWYLTPNGNQTSGAIAAASVSAGMKTLVFVQTTVFCEKCVKDFRARLVARPVSLSADEKAWHEFAIEELGGAEHCYLQLDKDGVLRAGAASHHSLLLREERELHEALFKRRDGIDALFATSTLAQGMNLPSEVVIISGDSRFDPGADKMKKLEAHELLNAAGRAGRAGDGAQGFVLLVPSKVIDFDDQKNEINDHWMELQSIFEQADQCLIIEDPMENLLDQIHNGIVKTGAPAYLLSKLPVRTDSASIDPAESLLRRSLAVYRAKKESHEDWIATRVSAALAARSSVRIDDESKWIEHVAGSTGLSVQILQQLIHLVDGGVFEGSTVAAIKNLLEWIAKNPATLMDLVRPEGPVRRRIQETPQ